MKRFLILFVTGVLLLTVQTTLLASSSIQKIRPDLVLIFILYLGFSFSTFSGGILAFLMGYLMDLFSGNVLGLYTFTRPLIFFSAQLFRNRFYWEGISFQCLFVFMFTVLEGFLILALLSGLNPGPLHNLYPRRLTSLLLQSVCTALVTPLFFALFNRGVALLLQRYGFDMKGQV